jgi:hypothetical protein
LPRMISSVTASMLPGDMAVASAVMLYLDIQSLLICVRL